MLYFFGKTLPIKKNILYSLKNIFGIGTYNSYKICKNIGINPSTRINSLNKIQFKQLIKFIDQKILIEQDLKKKIIDKKEHLLNIKSYRGIRNFQGLPVNGQRTHTNSKTKKKLTSSYTLKNIIKKKNENLFKL